MKITFLGTGTSQGIPVIACDCDVCVSEDPRDKRLRTSIMIEDQGTRVVIDSGPDFRQQMLREKVDALDALVFTHEHKDHVAGMDDVRAFNFKQQSDMQVYATSRVQEALKKEFHYVFSSDRYPGVPKVNLNTIGEGVFRIGSLSFQPIDVLHYKLPVKAFRIQDFTYVTDANFISDVSMDRIKGSRFLVINALRKSKHISHFNLEEALEVIAQIKPEKAYLTHISHLMGKHADIAAILPDNVEMAYDGLQLEV